MLERINRKYSVEEVFEFVNNNHGNDRKKGKERVEFDGNSMKPYSVRYQTFIKKGTTCVCCGLEGTFFYKERHQHHKTEKYDPNIPYHFNLYGVNEDGEEVLFTKDHIIARSLGGSDGVNNMQTMCTVCNNLKSDMTTEEWAKFDKTPQPEGEPRKRYEQQDYATAKARADKYGKQVFVVTSLENRIIISTNIKNARKKFPSHDVVSYEDFIGKGE